MLREAISSVLNNYLSRIDPPLIEGSQTPDQNVQCLNTHFANWHEPVHPNKEIMKTRCGGSGYKTQWQSFYSVSVEEGEERRGDFIISQHVGSCRTALPSQPLSWQQLVMSSASHLEWMQICGTCALTLGACTGDVREVRQRDRQLGTHPRQPALLCLFTCVLACSMRLLA